MASSIGLGRLALSSSSSSLSLLLRLKNGRHVVVAPQLSSSSSSSLLLWNRCRTYLGDAKQGTPTLSEQEEELIKIAKPKSEQIFQRHIRMPVLDEIPSTSFGKTTTTTTETTTNESSSSMSKEELELDIRKKRLIYRSKQRGWLEVDLLLGTWASQHVHQMSLPELDQYENFVNQETIDIYNIITLRTPVPESMKTPDGNGVVERIQAWARDHPFGKADPDTYKTVKTSHNLI